MELLNSFAIVRELLHTAGCAGAATVQAAPCRGAHHAPSGGVCQVGCIKAYPLLSAGSRSLVGSLVRSAEQLTVCMGSEGSVIKTGRRERVEGSSCSLCRVHECMRQVFATFTIMCLVLGLIGAVWSVVCLLC